MPDRLELSQFQPYVGHAFGVETAAGPLELTLAEASAGPWQPEGETAFAFELIFTGPREPVLPQAIYRMTHPDAGDHDIFIVPLKTAEDGTTYQAVFS
ncbi:MAG TPA: hypothetical protein VEV43_07810 [Actinomycetota bacterium]|nr:hypothetical protein [Actinomycetota bacterium]